MENKEEKDNEIIENQFEDEAYIDLVIEKYQIAEMSLLAMTGKL